MSVTDFIIDIVTNRIVISCLAALILAQLIKFAAYYIKEGKADIYLLFYESGGMPSSHASSVSALAAAVYFSEGVTSLFIVASVFAIVVMRDAAGIRWSAGQQSKLLNKMAAILKQNGSKVEGVKELAGHTPLQVLAGMLLGIACSAVVYLI